jgi:small subunit ribosomal protein S21
LKVLKRKLQREGVFKIMREKRHHEKPSEKKLRKSIEAQKRSHKSNRRVPRAGY